MLNATRSLILGLAISIPVLLKGQTTSAATPVSNVSAPGQQIVTIEGVPNLDPPVVNAKLGTAVQSPGSVTVTPTNMLGIAAGVELIIGSGAAQEVISVRSASSSQFTAVFANVHSADDPVTSRPSGLVGIDSTGNLSLDAAERLLNDTICKAPPTPGASDCALDSTDTYAIIHVLLWGPTSSSGSNDVKSIQSTNWYVYRKSSNAWLGHWNQADFSGNNRLYGAATIVFLYVQLNASVNTCDPFGVRYQLTITRRVPSNLQAVQQLAQMIVPNAEATNALRQESASACPNYVQTNVWGGRVVKIGYKTSDIKVDSFLLTKGTATPPTITSEPLSAPLSIINESKQWWDVSVAVPVKSVSSLQFTSSNNTVVPTQINKQNVFAAIDFYLPPVDLAGTTYNLMPHPIAGVSMASQPLHSILVGGAVGFNFAEIFVGADFIKQQSLTGLSSGSPATPQQLGSATSNTYKAQFIVGINLPVKAAYNSLKKTTK